MTLARSFFLGLLFCVFAHCQFYQVEPRIYEFEARYWFCDLNTQWKFRGPTPPSEYDFRETLGMHSANLPDLRFTYSKGKDLFRFGYAQAEYDGTAIPPRSIVFNGQTYPAGSQLTSHADFRQFRVSYVRQLVKAYDGKLEFGVLVDGYGFQHKTTINGATSDRWFGVPGVGPSLIIKPVNRIELFAEASGMSLGRYGFQAGGEAGVRVRAVRRIAGEIGYRQLRVRPNYDDPAKANVEFPYIRLDGVFIGVAARF